MAYYHRFFSRQEPDERWTRDLEKGFPEQNEAKESGSSEYTWTELKLKKLADVYLCGNVQMCPLDIGQTQPDSEIYELKTKLCGIEGCTVCTQIQEKLGAKKNVYGELYLNLVCKELWEKWRLYGTKHGFFNGTVLKRIPDSAEMWWINSIVLDQVILKQLHEQNYGPNFSHDKRGSTSH